MHKFGLRGRLYSGIVMLGLGVLASVPAQANVTYTCDVTISAGVCTTLNTTIAGLYTAQFNDTNFNPYIMMGSTGLGASLTSLNGYTYTTFRNALNADRTSANDTIGFNASVPVASPFGANNMALTNANARALGLAISGNGVTPAGAGCLLINAGCYDSIITISNTASLWFRTGGPQGATQYDFFSVVEHETDEGLGTIDSCCGQISGFDTPVDAYRYHSNGTRSLAFGANTSCGASNTTNACFSLNGVNMLLSYNNLNNGQDTGDFSTNCTFVQDAVGCLGGVGAFHDINVNAEILILDVIGYTFAAAVPEPATMSLFGAGLIALAFYKRRNRKASNR